MVTLVHLRAYLRFFVVSWQFLPLLWNYARDRRRFVLFGGRRRVSSQERVERARVLLDTLITLGPTFIKLGQLLSTRPDILPPEYIDVLAELQDRVPPAPWEDARVVIEEEVGPVDDRFEGFDTDAISGASLGQVYRAEVEGRPVAVKVRRPGVEDLVETDLRVIRWSLPFLLVFMDESRSYSLENLADEFAKVIRQEMDYEREARMLVEIRSNFDADEGIAMPDTVDSHSGARVLTMEYIGGTKISDVDALDAKGIDRSAVAERLQRAYMQMIMEDGVFHADPHPGNLAVKDDGTIVFYDFGMSAHVDEFLQSKIVNLYISIANQDIDGIIDVLVETGALSPEADRATMAEVLELVIEDARGEQIETYRVQQIINRIEDTIYEFPLRLPSNLALVLRMATVVEGVCISLDPDFDFIATASQFLRERGYLEAGVREYAREYGDQFRRSALSTFRTPPKLERMLDRFDRDDFYVRADIEDSNDLLDLLARRLVYGMVLTAGLLSTALLYPAPRPTAVAGALSFVVAAVLYRSFTRRRGIRARGGFTRQRMREHREE